MKASDIRRGNVILHNGQPFRVMDFNHHTPGNLRAMVQTKLRNLLTGNSTEVRFSATENIEEADVFFSKATYLYSDADGYHFMRTENFDQFSINAETLGDAVYYLQEQMEVEVTDYNGDPIGIVVPQTVILTVVETEPELKASTASNSPKPAKTETGLQLTVPPFIKEGERIVVNTVEGIYVKRAE